ncbi:hypothetical protein CLG85_013150 [Yangia mangrovi]|uniref:AAA+ family ATPase n=1 Tax=Alloyangia mangrovi TaxID=1779329 RepID=A0A2A3JPH6_9RHOB|nr:hypothetical protein [Alloyangia mangrovi]MCA0938354.1 hypothetical protein [Alloyangia pacifica]MCA0947973.1 hypothetical protein [Alloyangia pacifica]MCT4371212.1 hypothetical protein [Alloyangia mangrovi]
MSRIFPFALAACLIAAPLAPLATPAFSQAADTPGESEDTLDNGPGLMERGADMFLRGLRDELDPALQDLKGLADRMGPALQSFVDEMGPAMAQLSEQIEDWTLYEAPEMLPNGDILIRRREKLDPEAPEAAPEMPEAGPGGEIEL